MRDGDILILKGNEVAPLLDGRELNLIQAVRDAYVAHASGQSYLPHSTFVYFPNDPRSRIIALRDLSPEVILAKRQRGR